MSEPQAQSSSAVPANPAVDPASPPPVIPYATAAPRNMPAVLALISGLFVFVPFLGILTIILARRGMALAREGARGH